MILNYKEHVPKIHDSTFIAQNATIIGDVQIGAHCSVWFGAVIRGDVAPVKIGDYTNIQDQSVLHQSPNMPLTIEDHVTIGHRVTLHSCTVRSGALVGMDSTILDGAVIGENAFIGAGSLVTSNTEIPPNSLAFGRPAKVIRQLTDEDIQEMTRINATYVNHIPHYKG
ncbi:gamma carbonic anhydrase family protein [Nosocomiicoccus sp. HMSC067E10]|uniref:gamma carbonic anhydrase n=1 Tax=Nosocomiicoccus sp. HMSC067E10 TaxID=1739271 RepID=UPI0008A3483C|nr:gamma carbonic anhydrase family protein [Nosocomiicoccus sp. HMSC067E10]OFL46307.1 gamma carbonic anhydrase family protein [Nosocomiicoccus sp. HMSC067E10]